MHKEWDNSAQGQPHLLLLIGATLHLGQQGNERSLGFQGREDETLLLRRNINSPRAKGSWCLWFVGRLAEFREQVC